MNNFGFNNLPPDDKSKITISSTSATKRPPACPCVLLKDAENLMRTNRVQEGLEAYKTLADEYNIPEAAYMLYRATSLKFSPEDLF